MLLHGVRSMGWYDDDGIMYDTFSLRLSVYVMVYVGIWGRDRLPFGSCSFCIDACAIPSAGVSEGIGCR